MRKDELRSVGVDRVDIPKLKGNQNVRGDDGRWKDESLAGQPGYNVETDEHRSPWLKEWDRLGRWMELISTQSPNPELEERDHRSAYIDTLAVNAVIHAQVLKRP